MRIGRRGLAILVTAAIILAVAAVVAVVVFLALQRDRPGSTAWQDPLTQVVPAAIVPQLALYPLAGASEIETIDAGIDNGDFATAYAGLVYSLDVSDRQRIGRLVALGANLAAAEDSGLASVVFQQVYDLAILSPNLNDRQRAEALWRSSRGWGNLGLSEQALLALDQAEVIAAQSPHLQTAQRRSILVLLEEAYRDLGESKLAAEAQSQIAGLDQSKIGEAALRRATPADLPSGGEPISSPEVGALEEARRQAAYAVIDSLSRGEPASEPLSSLAEALKAEDAAKLSLYNQQLEATTQAGRRSQVHQVLVRWLLLKSRIAQKGFGLSVVPEWESQASDIQASLSRAYEELAFDYEDWSASLPDADQTAPSSYAALRSIVLSGRLGQYPNYPSGQLGEKVGSAVASMVEAGYVDDLYVALNEVDGQVQPLLSRSGGLSATP